MDADESHGLARAIAAAATDAVQPDATDRRIAVAIYTLLSGGVAVEPAAIAAQAGVDEPAVLKRLQQWPGIYRDDAGRIIGFWGLAISEMPHRVHIDQGTPMYAWCALDPFLITPVIGRNARVSSTDPVTGQPIAMTVTPTGIRDLSPPTTVVSLLNPAGPFGFDVLESLCHHVLYFTGMDTATQWAHGRDDITLLPAEQAFAVGRDAWQWLQPDTVRQVRS